MSNVSRDSGSHGAQLVSWRVNGHVRHLELSEGACTCWRPYGCVLTRGSSCSLQLCLHPDLHFCSHTEVIVLVNYFYVLHIMHFTPCEWIISFKQTRMRGFHTVNGGHKLAQLLHNVPPVREAIKCFITKYWAELLELLNTAYMCLDAVCQMCAPSWSYIPEQHVKRILITANNTKYTVFETDLIVASKISYHFLCYNFECSCFATNQ